MNVEELRTYCLSKKCTTEDFPFDEDTLVFKVSGKIFVICPLEWWERGEPAINLKCNPEYALELRENYHNIISGFHMSKKHWNTLRLNKGDLSPPFVFELIDHSYEMVLKGLTKKQLEEFNVAI